jgi:hypothetical protein
MASYTKEANTAEYAKKKMHEVNYKLKKSLSKEG